MEIAEGGVKARGRKSRMIPKSGFRFSEKDHAPGEKPKKSPDRSRG
jgi:hypothetical protein